MMNPLTLDFSNHAVLSMVCPIAVYWVTSLFYEALGHAKIPWVEKYRTHEPNAEAENKVSKRTVIFFVALQHVIQTILGCLFLDPEDPWENRSEALWICALRFFLGMGVIDTWQYFWHRAMHESTWLYRNVHSWHHKLYCPYAFGALFNHPLEGQIMDTLSALVAMAATGMNNSTAVFLFTFATYKTVSDHCGYTFPINPTHGMFGNNTKYHDWHHTRKGIKQNYSQPFFTFWDVALGSYHATSGEVDSTKKQS